MWYTYTDNYKNEQPRNYIAGTNVPEDPARLMGQVGLYLIIASLFFPPFILFGVIVSIVAYNKSKRYGFINHPAKLGVGIGIVASILILIVVIFVINIILI